MKEKKIADIIIKHYEENGKKVYREVTAKGSKGGGTKRVDLLIEDNNIFIAIEVKLNFNLTVIHQAWTWKQKSHYSYICIPSSKNTSLKSFSKQLCLDYGIGIIEVNKKGEIKITQESTYNTSPNLPLIYNEQLSGDSGIKSAEHITPFKMTVKYIIDYLKINGESDLNMIIDNINHHYKSKQSAKSSIIKMIDLGVIKDIDKVKINNKWTLKLV